MGWTGLEWVHDFKPMRFKYGNGQIDQSLAVVRMPAFIGGRSMTLNVHVVPGKVPFLVSKSLIGSVIVISISSFLPTCFAQSWYISFHCLFSEFISSKSKFSIVSLWSTSN